MQNDNPFIYSPQREKHTIYASAMRVQMDTGIQLQHSNPWTWLRLLGLLKDG